jgi:tetratricopeptide (TPR) repeat protein
MAIRSEADIEANHCRAYQKELSIMKTHARLLSLLTFSVAMAVAASADAQSFVIDIPLKSPVAAVSQRIGLTDIDIRYHRPLVNGRKIWGGLVPYGKVWRTGANVNTTISFSDPVTIDGHPLDRGTYGFHAIPAPGEWTLIFSKNSTSWGSFTYDQSEDALRVPVKPEPSPMHEELTFEIDHLHPDSAVVALEWENLRIPFQVGVDVHATVQSALKRQLRGLERYVWMSWDDAAGYLLHEKIALDDALAYADHSISMEDRFDNELTKSNVLAALNRPAESQVARRRAIALGSAVQLRDYGVSLLGTDREAAFAVFRENARSHPDAWQAHEGLARMYSAQGKFADALKEAQAALASAPESEKADLQAMAAKLATGKDVNG